MTTKYQPQPLRMSITWKVLEHARAAGDEQMVAICRRIIIANRSGWRSHRTPGDLRQVIAYYDAMPRTGLTAYAPSGNLVTVTVPK